MISNSKKRHSGWFAKDYLKRKNFKISFYSLIYDYMFAPWTLIFHWHIKGVFAKRGETEKSSITSTEKCQYFIFIFFSRYLLNRLDAEWTSFWEWSIIIFLSFVSFQNCHYSKILLILYQKEATKFKNNYKLNINYEGVITKWVNANGNVKLQSGEICSERKSAWIYRKEHTLKDA